MSTHALLRRALSGPRLFAATSILSVALLAAGTSSALAAGQSLSVTPCSSGSCTPASTSFPAGGDPSITTTAAFNAAPEEVTVALTPGVLANLTANVACIVPGGATDPSTCQIGSGTVSTSNPAPANALPFSAYLTPAAKATDIAGVDMVITGLGTVHGELSLVQGSSGAVQAVLTVPLGSAGASITGLALSLNGTLDGKPFLRMPTDCTPSPASSLTVVYSSGSVTTAASPDVSPTGCAALPYAPVLSGTATKDPTDTGVRVDIVTSQAAGQAANKSVTLAIPAGALSPQLVNAVGDFGKVVGSAVVASPLSPVAITGTATLTGNAEAPTLTLAFPAPFAFSVVGTISLANNSVTFSDVPDIPTSSLSVIINGGPTALFGTTCAQPTGTFKGSFVGQNGGSGASTASITVAGCATAAKPGPPTVSGGSITGLKTGSAKLSFTLSAGKNAPKLSSFTVTLPSGVSFSKATLAKDVSVSGAKVKSAKLSGGKLVVTLKSAASKLKFTAKALKVSSSLEKKVKDKKVKSLTAKIAAKDTAGKSTTLSLKLTKLS